MIRAALQGGPLTPLTAYRQFMLWTVTEGRKVPLSPHTLAVASVTDPASWGTAEQCLKLAASRGYGVAFVFTEQDPFFFADIDHAYQSGAWSPLSQSVITKLPGTVVEVSQSGTGLHLFGRYSGARPTHACKNTKLGLELYTADRFVALTGTHARGSLDTDCTAALLQYIEEYFKGGAASRPEMWDAPVAVGATPPATDEELIQLALRSKSTGALFDSGKATFADLWAGDTSKHGGDASSADRALAQHLAFWTGNDCERILRIMKQSGLVRDKWEREDYLYRTILSAVSSCTKFYNRPTPATAAVVAPDQPGYKYLGSTQQLELFAGCVYITELHRVLVPTGEMLKPEQFRVRYGGYVFPIDTEGRKTTRNAWEAFTESQLLTHPKVAGTTFRPELPLGAIVEQYGMSAVNTYTPIPVPRKQGDASPFLRHLAKLLPLKTDQDIVLAYMAACVQHKGIKFQWAPLLQGVPGNGKTLLTRCVAEAIGLPYVHFPKAEDLDNKFNSWLLGKCFIGVEDIYVPKEQLNVLEALKPMITNEVLEIQFKGVDQVTKRVCANFMLNSNHKDAIRKTEDDRRFCVFYTAQQSVDDLKRDGMTNGYFPHIYDWLRAEGYAIVSELLHTYQIPPHLNPAGACDRAPRNSCTEEVLSYNRDWREQAILEAIESATPGMSNGWIASTALNRFVKAERLHLPPPARNEILARLGYIRHPGLPDGRSSAIIASEGGRPTLYVRKDSPAARLTDHKQIISSYEGAQRFE